jgi:manganese/zinc/iron transport system ATP- binding protein
MAPTVIAINNLTVTYNNKIALWNINAHIPQGALLGIVGPNGAGKSTLIKSVIDLVKPVAGTITIFGGSYAQHRHQIAYIPQRSTIDWTFPVTALDVVLMGRYRAIGWFRWPSKQDTSDALAALDQLGLAHCAHTHIGQLSGGQQQRIFLARALLQNADVYLMDEPFIGIDTITESTTVALLKQLCTAGKTVIVVHHDLETVKQYFDWILLLNIERIAYGQVNQVFTPEHLAATYGTHNGVVNQL